MQNQSSEAQGHQSPRSVLPPLSKYYYGPAQRSGSPQRVNLEESWARGTTAPPLPPRQPGSAEALSASQWMNHFASKEQLWQLPGPPASAPPTSHPPDNTYSPSTYGPMPGAQPTVVTSHNASSVQRRPSNSKWEETSRQPQIIGSAPVAKPPLPVSRPPRPYASIAREGFQNSMKQTSSYALGNGSVDFLPSVAYSPTESATQNHHVPSRQTTHETTSPPPQRLPPPPPPKVPPDHRHSGTQNDTDPGDPHVSETLNEGQRQYERFKASQEDSITYSIPSSIWRQDPPPVPASLPQSRPESRTMNGVYDRYGAEQQQEHRPISSNGPRIRENRTESLNHRSIDRNGQSGQGSHLPRILGKEREQQVPLTWDSTGAQKPHQETDSAAWNVGWDESGDEQQRSDSFYWQSPHSSIHSTGDEQVQQATEARPIGTINDSHGGPPPDPESVREDYNAPIPSALLSHPSLGTYGASALGFGGPSDWEHFGDYAAEDIDDTDLYLRPRSPAKDSALAEKAELPAVSVQENGKIEEAVGPLPESIIESGSIPRPEVTTEPAHNEPDSGEATSYSLYPEDLVQDSAISGEKDPRAFPDSGIPSSLHLPPAGIRSTALGTPKSEFPHTDLDETIKAWSTAGSTENLSDGQSIGKTPAKHQVAFSDHIIEPTAGDNVQSDIPAPPVARDVSRAEGTPPDQPSKDQATDNNPASIPIEGVGIVRAEKSGRESVFQAPTSPTQHDSIQNSRDPETVGVTEPKPVDREAPEHQPTLTPVKNPSTKAYETDDPYAGLDPWGKASLNRYIAMLREESRAETDKEKLTIFTVFTTRETRLRAVLYDADQEEAATPTIAAKANPIASPINRVSTTSFKRASKALPALPESVRDQEEPPRAKGHARKPSKKLSAATILGNPKPALHALDTTSTSPPDETSVVVESPSSVQYSAGGRPVVARAPKTTNNGEAPPGLQGIDLESVGEAPVPNEHNDLPRPNSTDPPASKNTSSYAPVRYSGSHSEAQNYAANRLSKRQSVLRPYSKMMGSDEHRLIFPNGMLSEQDNPKLPTNGNVFASSSTSNEKVELDLRHFERADFDPLTSVLPEAGDIRSESLQLLDLKGVMDPVPDDFTFIHQAVIAWDGKAKRQRDSNERARHARQVESEQRIDALFDDHEIGYGDISELESGFKRSEAARKADEDRAEYQTFVSEVFNIVWTRLHYEMDQLTPHYQRYTAMLNDTTAGKDMFDPSSDRFALAPTMDSLLTLHQKLEIRHQKAFEAVLERDRRLKKVELSPWYSLGNVAKVKQLEKQFDGAEKKAILDYCRQRDIRANNLMDNLDQNTLRGVGANQDYMEMVMKAVRRIASGRAFASQPGSSEPGVGLEEVTKAKSVTKALATSSEQIVQTFHVADMLLNAADYELSVAKARLEGADVATFQNLKEERAKEDQKLMRDLEHRLALIREDSRRTHDEIVKLLLFLGVQSGHAEASSGPQKPVDPGHEERLHKALEEAKRRNATKESAATPLI